jgi:hypothetical protein
LSLSIDPVDTLQKMKEEKELNDKLEVIGGRPKFQTIKPSSKLDFSVHPKKPPGDILDDLTSNPWH